MMVQSTQTRILFSPHIKTTKSCTVELFTVPQIRCIHLYLLDFAQTAPSLCESSLPHTLRVVQSDQKTPYPLADTYSPERQCYSFYEGNHSLFLFHHNQFEYNSITSPIKLTYMYFHACILYYSPYTLRLCFSYVQHIIEYERQRTCFQENGLSPNQTT